MNRQELTLERQLVLMGSIEVGEKQADQFIEWVGSNPDWSDIIFQLVTHRTLNMFCFNLKKFELMGKLEKELQRLMDTQWQVYHERNSHYLRELTVILEEFEKYNLVVPIVKGNLLVSKVYPVLESRIFNDVDMLMKLDDVEKVTKALEGLGYKQGHYDEKQGIIVEASRKEKMLQQMTSHELQEFQKLSDNRFAKLIQVDVNHDILWKGHCPYKVPTHELIGRAIPIDINGVKGYMLDYIDNIIQLSCHLYKEATLMMWITDLRDLKIYKFADLYIFIKKFYDSIDWQQLVERVTGYNLQKVVYYNFHYIELMFGEIVPVSVMSQLKPDDLTYLDEYGIENEEPSVWGYEFFTRLFDTNRVLSLSSQQYSGMSRYLDAKAQADGVFHHRLTGGNK